MAIAGIVLLVLGVLLAVSEAHAPSHGVSGSVGVALMSVGLVLALVGAGVAVAIGVGAAALLAAGGGGLVALTMTRSATVRRRRVRGGAQGLIGEIGTVRTWADFDGSVSLHGAVWQARRSSSDEEPPPQLHTGDRVVVERLSGLTLSVRPAEEWELI